MRVLVLGAGFGGLELSTRLAEELGDDVDVVLIDRSDGFMMGSSKLDIMFGLATPDAVRRSYADLGAPGVRFVHSVIRSIDPASRSVETDDGHFEGDVLVVALGADPDASLTPGLTEAGHEFYTPAGAFAARDALAAFAGGRAIIGVMGAPFKCPPAPSEAALMLHDFLAARGVREATEISLVMPFGAPVPPSSAASKALVEALADRGISWRPNGVIRRLDADRRVVALADGDELPFDLFLGVPLHRVPAVVAESGMCVDGWIPVDAATMETSFPDVYAIGDVTDSGAPKAGSFSERQAGVVADRLIARHRGEAAVSTYDGMGVCYVEFGGGRIGRIEVAFPKDAPPSGVFDDPSEALRVAKETSGSERMARWFGPRP